MQADLHTRHVLPDSVIAEFVPLGFRGGVGICYPVSKSEACDENDEGGKDRVEEIEGSDRANAYEVKKRTLYA
jgi:hypothetical protein